MSMDRSLGLQFGVKREGAGIAGREFIPCIHVRCFNLIIKTWHFGRLTIKTILNKMFEKLQRKI